MMITMFRFRMLSAVSLLLFAGLMHAVTAGAGTAALSWDPPTTNENGTPIQDLAGYKIYYGTSPGTFTSTIDVGNRTTYQFAGLTDGVIYYFAVTAYNIYGSESEYSQTVSKAMPLPQYTLTVSRSGAGPGTVISSPSGIACGSTCSASYAGGTVVTLTAVPDASAVFNGWSGACSGAGTCAVTMDAARSVNADFRLKTHTITATAGAGGSISPSGVVSVSHGANQAFTIAPSTGYLVADVMVDGVSTGPASTYTFSDVTGDHAITASFVLQTYTITATGGAGGSISPSGGIIVSHGASQTFTIMPNTGYAISNVLVDGTSAGAVGSYTFTDITANHTINASFSVNVHTLTVSKAGSGTGTVTSSPAGISCGSTCSASYAGGTVVTLTAVPDASADFNGWSGACSGTGTCAVTMDAAKTVYPLYTLKPLFSMGCADSGIPCVERVGGGSDADNLVGGKPRADVEYEFSVTVKDTGGTPLSVRILTAQRSEPQPGDLAAYPLACAGDFGAGALCTFRTRLGPAAEHRYCFEAAMSDGTTVKRYPETGFLAGPHIRPLAGYGLLGVPRNMNAAALDGLAAFGSASAYRWDPVQRYYTMVTPANPVRAGEGYFVFNSGAALPELAEYRDVPGPVSTYRLKPGWNIISNPFAANVRLANVDVQRGTAAPVGWQEATANGWIANALYAYSGGDWGGTYGWESGDTALLVPWMGYALYLKAGDSSYNLIISKP